MKLKLIDARYIQIFNNCTLIVYGYYNLNFSRQLSLVPIAIFVSLILEFLLSKYFFHSRANRTLIDRSISIVNTAVSVSTIITLNRPEFYLYAIIFSIFSKYIFRVNDQHVFNPANFGIVIAFLFVNDTSYRIIYNQFFSSNMLPFWFVIANGLIIAFLAKRLILSFSYLFFICGLLFLLSPSFGFDRLFLIGPTFSISGLLFVFFMITDPKTTPNLWWQQILFGFFCALIAALFRLNQLVHDMFIALFLVCGGYSFLQAYYLNRQRSYRLNH